MEQRYPWDEGTEIITSRLDDIEIILQIDNNEMFRNGKAYTFGCGSHD